MTTDHPESTAGPEREDTTPSGTVSRGEATEHGQFPMTRWSMVLAAQAGNDTNAFAALSELCQVYWYPLYAYSRRTGMNPDDASDAVQGFFGELLEKDYLASADRERGKLRSFLLISLKHHMSKQREKARAAKRGGGMPHISIDQEFGEERYQVEPAEELTPDVIYERDWALTLLDNVMRALESNYVKKGKGDLFRALKGFLEVRQTERPYSEIAGEFDMTENAVKQMAYQLRKRYKNLLHEAIADTVDSHDDVEEEIRYLVGLFET